MWQGMPGKKGVYQKNLSIYGSLRGIGCQARKECIKSISFLFVAMDDKQDRSVSKIFLISSWQGLLGKKGAYPQSTYKYTEQCLASSE